MKRFLLVLAVLVTVSEARAVQQLAIWSFDSLSGISNGSAVNATTETVAGTPTVTIRNSDIYSSGQPGVAYTDALGVAHSAGRAIGWSDFKKSGQPNDGQLDISLNTTGFSGLTLRFNYRHNHDNDGSENQLRWLYSLNGGSTWLATNAFTVTDDNTWRSKTFALPAAVDSQSSLVIRIEKNSDDNATEVNNILLLDNIEITSGSGSGGSGQGPVITPVNIPPVPSTTPVILSSALGDTADAARSNIVLAVADPDTADAQLTATASSSAPAVATASVVRLTNGDQDTFQIILQPLSVGYANITVTVRDPQSNSATYAIQYAVSAAASTPTASRYHSGSSDASAALGLDANWMLVADDENQLIRLYNRQNSGLPFKTFDVNVNLNLAKEADFEAVFRIGNRIYWLGSHGNDKDGNAEPTRSIAFSADISGATSNPTLTYVNKFTNLKANLIAWDNANGHGLGSAALGLAASAATGVPCNNANGFNIEAAAYFNNSKVYLGFRTPLQNTSARNKALVIPVNNFPAIVNAGAGTMTFDPPIFLDLGGRCLRDMATTATGELLLLAGPNQEASTPSFEFFLWDGTAAGKPRRLSTSLNAATINGSGYPEAIVIPPDAIALGSQVQVLQDNGTTVFYNDSIVGKDLATRQFAKSRSDLLTIGQARVVTTLVDENNVVPGTGVSLREAVAASSYPDTISFTSTLNGATIVLNNGPININSNATIDATALANGITISGNNAARVFQIAPGADATLRGLSITGGQGNPGAGIFNNGGNLILSNCTLAGNASAGPGGALYAITGATVIVNSTIASNTATQGAGIAHASGTLALKHVTLAGNTASSLAGGLLISAGTATLSNTLVAGNTAPANPNIQGTFTGTGNLTSGMPKLAPLAYYDSPTKTMPPLPGSPAIDGTATTILTTDQRGAARPHGPLPDIGAVEAFPFSSLAQIDTDGDGVDDRLEPAYGLVVGVNNSAADSDGDGQTDAAEIATMTDALDSTSSLRITNFAQVSDAPPLFSVTFTTFPGLDYELEAAQELGGFAFVPDSHFTATAYSTTLTLQLPLAPGRGFVRAVRR